MRYSQKYLNENKEQLDEAFPLILARLLGGLWKGAKGLGKGAAGAGLGAGIGSAVGSAAAGGAKAALDLGKETVKALVSQPLQHAMRQADAHSGGSTTHRRGLDTAAQILGTILPKRQQRQIARTQERRHRERVGVADRSRRS